MTKNNNNKETLIIQRGGPMSSYKIFPKKKKKPFIIKVIQIELLHHAPLKFINTKPLD